MESGSCDLINEVCLLPVDPLVPFLGRATGEVLGIAGGERDLETVLPAQDGRVERLDLDTARAQVQRSHSCLTAQQ